MLKFKHKNNNMKQIFTFLIIATFFSSALAQQVPDFTITDTDGNSYHLYEELEKGKTIIIDFFGLQCGSCQTDMGALEQFWQDNGAENGDVWIWAIESLGGTDQEVASFVSINGGTFPSFRNTEEDSLLQLFDVDIIPSYFVICPNGFVKKSGIDKLDIYLEGCSTLDIGDDTQDVLKNEIIGINTGNSAFLDIAFTIEHSGSLTFELYDLLGNKIISKTSSFAEGKGTTRLNKSGLSPGYYLIRMTNNKTFMETKRIVIN